MTKPKPHDAETAVEIAADVCVLQFGHTVTEQQKAYALRGLKQIAVRRFAEDDPIILGLCIGFASAGVYA